MDREKDFFIFFSFVNWRHALNGTEIKKNREFSKTEDFSIGKFIGKTGPYLS